MDIIKLLNTIEKDASLSIVDLSKVLNEKESDIEKSLSILEKNNVICGRHTLINWNKANVQKVKAIIQVCCSPEKEYGYDKIAKKIYMFDEVSSMSLISGSNGEFMVTVKGKTMQEIAEFVGSKLAPVHGVSGTSTLFVLKEYKKSGIVLSEDNDEIEDRQLVTP